MNTVTPFLKLKHIPKTKLRDTDKSVRDMLENWDIVTCYYCGKNISMLDGKLINNGQHFVCKKHQIN